MLTFYSATAEARRATTELHGGRLVEPFESPKRTQMILASLRKNLIGDIALPTDHGDGPILRVHDSGYVEFLARAWAEWQHAGYQGEAIPTVWPTRRTRIVLPKEIGGELGYYALAGDTSIESNTYLSARASVDIALSAFDFVSSSGLAAFGLCRPPGHHAAVDQFGGYCFMNNAAIVAQYAIDRFSGPIAILDIDYHHGNGTQQIFYDRGDVLYVSLHCNPSDAFPYFLGYRDEEGDGKGKGANANYPLPSGTDYELWSKSLAHAIDRVKEYAARFLVVSLGVDTYRGDPLGSFTLDEADFVSCGRAIATVGVPTVFLMEGGYAVDAIGTNVSNVLRGYEEVRGGNRL